MPIGNLIRLEFKTKHKRWVFPNDRFVEWGPEDESYCRLAGYGLEEIREVTVVIPRALITGISKTGEIEFRGVPEGCTA